GAARGGTAATCFGEVSRGNTGYAAGPGFDLVAGLGTPKADQLVAFLAKWGTAAAGSTGSGTSGTIQPKHTTTPPRQSAPKPAKPVRTSPNSSVTGSTTTSSLQTAAILSAALTQSSAPV